MNALMRTSFSAAVKAKTLGSGRIFLCHRNLNMDSLGIIAGSRRLPFLIAQEARRSGLNTIVAVGFEGETDPSLADWVDELIWVRVGQLAKMIQAFTCRGIRHCVMAGQVAPKNLFHLRPDFRAMGVLWRLKERNAHTIFGAIAEELQKDGVTLIEATPWLGPWMPKEGYHAGPPLAPERWNDVQYGFQVAKEIARLEIGQSVVVKEGTVLAVEGFEGTDACLTRGGKLAGKEGKATAVKVARKNHDMRFDIPCVGPKTLETCRMVTIDLLVVEAERTLLLDKEEMEQEAEKCGISVIATTGRLLA